MKHTIAIVVSLGFAVMVLGAAALFVAVVKAHG